jgi:hypothetical protein
MTPVLKSAKQLGLKKIPEGTRASMNGQVPASTTYQQWLARQPIVVQEQVLGKARAQLFRDGKIKIEKFLNANYEQFSLEDLRKTEKTAFKRAGLEL